MEVEQFPIRETGTAESQNIDHQYKDTIKKCNDLRTVKSILAKLLVPTVLITIAGHQLYCSKYFNLSNWKGGGFGMYSEIHCFISRQLWVESDTGYYDLGSGVENYKYGMHLKKVKVYPTQKVLTNLANELKLDKNVDTVHMQLWELAYDIQTKELKRIKLLEGDY